MDIHHHINPLRQAVDGHRASGKRIAVVPTMGNLHEGHLSLVTRAREVADHVITTIFVNPMQFGQSEDLAKYPRTLAEDTEKLAAVGCHTLFAPANDEIYPGELAKHTVVSVPELSALHCGASRMGHFDGVTTVVCKLFNIVQADVAVFGLKDYQQFALIRKVIEDLCFPIELVGVATCRDASGLAMSSRNGYLTAEQRRQATILYRTLCETQKILHKGNRDFHVLEETAQNNIKRAGLRPEYFTICHADSLAPAKPEDDSLVILAAAHLGNTRLIDNIKVNL